MSKLHELISRTVYKSQLSGAFNRINYRKERAIKAKLSLILLNTLIEKVKSEEKRTIVHKFAKNRFMYVGAEKIFKHYQSKY